MKADSEFAKSCLDAWASWVRQRIGAWPSQTLLGRIIEQGVSGAAQCGAVESFPEHIARTDRAVARLDAQLQRVIKVHYLTYAPCDTKAARCGVSVATFYRQVRRAQRAVAEHLNNYSTRRESETQYSGASWQMVPA